MNPSIVMVVAACLALVALVLLVWTVHARVMRVESFLNHLERRLILLQEAEFSRRLSQEGERWRNEFSEEPPRTLADDVRMTFDIAPPFKQCEAELNAIYRATSRSNSA